jgi:DNA replication protein DnaC
MRRLLQAEQVARQVRSRRYQRGVARFPIHRERDPCQGAAADVKRALVEPLASAEFTQAAHTLILGGGTGTGKTHLATALGIFHRVSQLYARTRLILTTNRSCAEWVQSFGDAKMTTALLDRITHHGNIIETGNNSYRCRHCHRSPNNPHPWSLKLPHPPSRGG